MTVTDPTGKVTDYTGSPRLRYEGFGCLTVSSLGTFTATPVTGDLCATTRHTSLWVQLTDTSGRVINFNGLLFKMI